MRERIQLVYSRLFHKIVAPKLNVAGNNKAADIYNFVSYSVHRNERECIDEIM